MIIGAHTCEYVRMPKRVTVILSEEDYDRAVEEAGPIPLSAWFRMKAFGTTLRAANPLSSPTVLLVGPENPAAVVFENQVREFYTEPVIKKIVGEGRKPCKHGLLFCKKCA